MEVERVEVPLTSNRNEILAFEKALLKALGLDGQRVVKLEVTLQAQCLPTVVAHIIPKQSSVNTDGVETLSNVQVHE